MSADSSASAVPEPMNPVVPSNKLGMWWFLASEIMVFGAVLASFILFRMAGPGWGEQIAHNNVALGSLNTLILLTSSFTIVESLSAYGERDEAKFKKYMGITIALGIVFLAVKGVEYTQHIQEGFLPDSHIFWAFYFGMTGLHALHVIAGIVANISLLVVVSKPGGFERYGHRAEFNGLYWHLVDIIWIFLFPLIYLG